MLDHCGRRGYRDSLLIHAVSVLSFMTIAYILSLFNYYYLRPSSYCFNPIVTHMQLGARPNIIGLDRAIRRPRYVFNERTRFNLQPNHQQLSQPPGGII